MAGGNCSSNISRCPGMIPGVEESILSTLLPMPDCFPIQFTNGVSKLLAEFLTENISSDFKREKLLNFLTRVCSYHIQTFNEFLWYIRLTSCILLFKNTDTPLFVKQQELLSHTFKINADVLNDDPIRIHLVAKAIYHQMDKNVQNILYLITQYCNCTLFMLYASVCLTWILLHTYNGLPIKMFRMYETEKILILLNNLNVKELIEIDFPRFYQFIMVVITFRQLVIYRHRPKRSYGRFIDYFNYTLNLKRSVNDWLDNVQSIIERVSGRNNNIVVDYINIIEALMMTRKDPYENLLSQGSVLRR